VSTEQLNELGIQKGVMTLVGERRQAEIITRLGSQESNRGSGGSAANSIIAISQLGGQVFYSGRVADDEMGRFYLKDLANAGVVTSVNWQSAPEAVTGKCLVLITPDAERTMNTFLGASADLSPEDVDVAAIVKSAYAYIEGYLVTGPTCLSAAIYAAQQARTSGTRVAFTLSDPNIVKFYRAAIEKVIGDGVDLLFANEEEAKQIAGTEDLKQAMEYVQSIAGQFVITLGPNGAIAYDGECVHRIAPVPTQAVDTVGAGDIYAGGFLYGITHGMDFARAGRLASMAASRVVSNMGPRLEQEEMRGVLTAFQAAE
jgi:sugar/nucleoside kinase (ribokinase family)